MKDKTFQLGGFYTLYSKKLEKEIRTGEIPKHIAIILDGNRRWAKRNLVLKVDGHFRGADAVEKLLDWCEELNIKIITLYVLSAENLARNDGELEYLYDLINQRLEKLYNDPRIHKNRMKVKAIGSIELLPDFLKEILNKLETATKDYDNHYLNIAIAYGGQNELVDAVKKIGVRIKEGSLDVNQIDKEVIESCLYTSHLPQSSPDMILRTSGEKRLSGFLMWQSAYSELVFMDIYWPEFRKIDLMRAIRTFQKRRRRLGK
ncbi:MAG: di-trans,poly-cis-decaprenylcistransferase [Thaumarchaeota archaeon]|nr:di-trans,poly-cis-decaprenylcistransferase [Nitrososphaerota archaeon]